MDADPAAVTTRNATRTAALLAWATAALVLSWQTATVQFNYSGNWTALFCTGDDRPAPSFPALQPTYRFPHSPGYDGQHYRAVAHDPWMTNRLADRGIDDPRVRYQRILLPALAYGTAFGRQEWIDTAYLAWIAASIGLGVFWAARFAAHAGWPVPWGLAFALLPANLVAMDRAVVDGLFCTLVAGAVWYARTGSWRLYLVLAALPLTRETGFIPVAAAILAAVMARRWRQASGALAALAPAILWYRYVHARTPDAGYRYRLFTAADWVALLTPYPATTPLRELVLAADIAAWAGIVLLFAVTAGSTVQWLETLGRTIGRALRMPGSARFPSLTDERTFAQLAAAGLTLIGLSLFVVYSDHWTHVYSFGRVHSPVLIFGLAASRTPSRWLLTSLALMVPRTLMQLAPQALGIARALS